MENQSNKTKPFTNPHAPLFLNNPADKGIVVFIHGFLGSPRQFDSLADSVHKEGFSAAALLLPGHGGSTKEFKSGTYEGWQRHVDSEVERFSQVYNSIWLVGHSMGGLLAINTATRFGGFIRGIFPIASPFKLIMFSAHAMKLRIKQMFSTKRSRIKSAYLNTCSVALSPSLLWRVAKPMAEVKVLMQAAKDNLPNVRAPVTAAYSTSDEVTAFISLETLKSGLTGTCFEQVLLADSTHVWYSEHDWAVIEQALLRMIL